MDLPRVIAFDGDDTLWHNETLFSMTQGRFRALLSRHVDIPIHILNARLLETERRNIPTYGYGIKGFVLSMIETAIEVTDKRIPAEDIQTILTYGRTMLEHPVELIEARRIRPENVGTAPKKGKRRSGAEPTYLRDAPERARSDLPQSWLVD